jgi:type I restriction-modification system DNA methylase subunit
MNRSKKIRDRKIPNDVFITPKHIVKKMIEMISIQEHETILDPCKGEGAFYDELIGRKNWCEISLGKDFYDYKEQVDVIIGNPPFSQWDKWMEHTISLQPKRICYLFGALNLTPNRLKKLSLHGYHVTKLCFVRINGYFGHSYLTVLEKKDGIIDIL